MNFIVKPSLEHITLVRVATIVWSQHDITDLIRTAYCSLEMQFFDQWDIIECEVEKKVFELHQPELLKQKILYFIKQIGLQIKAWIWKDHCNKYYFGSGIPSEFCWAPQGTIDERRTAKILIKDENRDITKLYMLACVNCLEKEIFELWNKMLENDIECFCTEFVYAEELIIATYWTQYIKREFTVGKMLKRCYCSTFSYYFNQFIFEHAIKHRAVIEYFLHRLTPRERDESLVKVAKLVADEKILHFLLSQMSEEQQMEVFKSDLYRTLKSFFIWPQQVFFVKVAQHVLNLISVNEYSRLLEKVIIKFVYKNCNDEKFFEQLWQLSPSICRENVIDKLINDSSCYLLPHLLVSRHIKNIKLIVKDMTPLQKKNLMLGQLGPYVCKNLLSVGECDLLIFLMQECLLSKDEIKIFKEKCETKFLFEEPFRNDKAALKKWNEIFISNFGVNKK